MKKLVLTSLALALPLMAVSGSCQSDAPGFAASYSLTGTGFGSAEHITKPGKIYVIRQDGMQARAIANHVTPTNTVTVEGKLVPPAKGFLGAFGTSGDAQQVKPGQRFYVHEIEAKDGGIVFTLISLDTVSAVNQGHSTQSRLRFYLKFLLPKEDADKPTPEALHKLTDAYFLPEGDPGLTPTVQLGQSEADVRKLMGDPVKMIDLGSKKILVYKDIKVTIIDDKVTDAQ
jgi:hypothetical protein